MWGNQVSRRLLFALSLDVLLRVVRALGISAGRHEPDLVPGRLTRILKTAEAQQVVQRAFSRMDAILEQGTRERYTTALHFNELRTLRDEAAGYEEKALQHVFNMVAVIDAQYAFLSAEPAQLCLF